MQADALVVKSNFKRNKSQNILVGLVVVVCALIMTTGFATFGGMFTAFDSMYKNQKMADLMLIISESLYDVDEEYEWWSNNEDISLVSNKIRCTDNRSITVNGKKLSSYSESAFFAVKSANEEVDILKFSEGEPRDTPRDGEVWIPTCYANTNNLNIGDKILVPVNEEYVELEVSAIVVDPYYSSGFIYPYRMWVNDNSYEELETDQKNNMLLVKLKEGVSTDSIWKDYTEHLDGFFVGTMLDIGSVRFAYLIMTGIICGILLAFSVLILVITLYVVTNTLSVSILSDYTNIGIMKALGCTSRQVRWCYVELYGAICAVAAFIGVLLSLITSKLLLFTFGKTMGLDSYSALQILPYMVFTFILLTVISVAIINRSARQAGKVSAVQAIKFGAPPKSVERKKVLNKNVYKLRSISLIYALKQMKTNTKQIAFLLVATLVTVVVVVFSVNVFVSVRNMDQDMSVWGMDKSDVRIEITAESDSEDDLMDVIQNDERVEKSAAFLEYIPASIEATDKLAATVLVGNIYEGKLDDIGLCNISGNNPSNSNEISLGVNTAKKYEVEVGDKFEIILNGKELEYTISGIYQTASNTGNGYRLTSDGYERSEVDFKSNTYAIILKDGVDTEEFIDEYSSKYGDEMSVENTNSIAGGSISSITSSVGLGVLMMSIMFVGILLIIIANVVILYVHHERNNYGIMKVCGMSPSQLHISLIEQMWIVLALAVIIGIPLAIFGTPVMMSMIMSSMGMVQYPITRDFVLTSISMVILFVVISIVFWFSSGRILKTNVRSLISE